MKRCYTKESPSDETTFSNRPVTRILCGGGANEAKVDQTTEMFFFFYFF